MLVDGVPAAGHGVPGADDEVLDGDAEAGDEFEAVVVLGGVHGALQDGLAAVHQAEDPRHLRDGHVGTEQRAEAAGAAAEGGGVGGGGKVVEVVEDLAEEVGRGGGQDDAVGHQGAVGADDLHIGEPSAMGTQFEWYYFQNCKERKMVKVIVGYSQNQLQFGAESWVFTK